MESTETSPPQQGSVIRGMLICWGLNLLTIALGLVTIATLLGPILLIGGIGLAQILYVWPLYNKYKRENQPDTGKGLVIGASVTALLNTGCLGFVTFYSP